MTAYYLDKALDYIEVSHVDNKSHMSTNSNASLLLNRGNTTLSLKQAASPGNFFWRWSSHYSSHTGTGLPTRLHQRTSWSRVFGLVMPSMVAQVPSCWR